MGGIVAKHRKEAVRAKRIEDRKKKQADARAKKEKQEELALQKKTEAMMQKNADGSSWTGFRHLAYIEPNNLNPRKRNRWAKKKKFTASGGQALRPTRTKGAYQKVDVDGEIGVTFSQIAEINNAVEAPSNRSHHIAWLAEESVRHEIAVQFWGGSLSDSIFNEIHSLELGHASAADSDNWRWHRGFTYEKGERDSKWLKEGDVLKDPIPGKPPLIRQGMSCNQVGNYCQVIIGGHDGLVGFFNDIHVFHTALLIWIPVEVHGNGPSPRAHHATGVFGSTIALFGGCEDGLLEDPHGHFGDTWLLDCSQLRTVEMSYESIEGQTFTLSWKKPAIKKSEHTPDPRSGATLTAMPGTGNFGKFFLFGGCCAGLKFSDDKLVLEEYEKVDKDHGNIVVRKHRWRKIQATGHMPTPRAGHTCSVIGSRMLIFGGWNGWMCLSDIYEFNLKKMTFTKIISSGASPAPRFGHTATKLPGGSKLLVFGGASKNDTNYQDVWVMEWIKASARNKAAEAEAAKRAEEERIAEEKRLAEENKFIRDVIRPKSKGSTGTEGLGDNADVINLGAGGGGGGGGGFSEDDDDGAGVFDYNET